jgi:putative spermidine/putrescine transport system permease protein
MLWLPPQVTMTERLARLGVFVSGLCVLLFLFLPTLVVILLSFSSEPFFTFPIPGVSDRWFRDFFLNPRWTESVWNSAIVAVSTTVLATVPGTAAALGLARRNFPGKTAIMALLISPMIVPIVIFSVGAFLFYSWIGLADTRSGLIVAHTALASPFVVITVSATLANYDWNLGRAAASLGAPPPAAFLRVTLPIILPGVLSGALFAFGTSFDEVIVALFLVGAERRTLPMQMFSGIRDQVHPTIMAAATVLIVVSSLMLLSARLLARRNKAVRSRFDEMAG